VSIPVGCGKNIKVKMLFKKHMLTCVSLFNYRGYVNGHVFEWPHRTRDSEPHHSNGPVR